MKSDQEGSSQVRDSVLHHQLSFFSRMLDRLMPGKGSVVFIFWVISIFALLAISTTMNSVATQFFGITESREQTISFQYPVEIVEIPVVEGVNVEREDRLLQVRRYDLNSELAIIDDNIVELTTRRRDLRASTNAEIESLRAQQHADIAKINTEIQTLASRFKLNQEISSNISNDKFPASNASQSPLQTTLVGLKRQKRHIENLLQAKIDNLVELLQTNVGPAEAQISELRKRRVELQRQAAELTVVADFDGSVGTVLYKPGEQVPAFQPIVTIHSETARYVKAYIHEAVLNTVAIGQSVWVTSLANSAKDGPSLAAVESLGSRIVEYPERLRKNPLVSAWGREVVVRLDDRNKLLMGEKVVVGMSQPVALKESVAELFRRYVPIKNALSAPPPQSQDESIAFQDIKFLDNTFDADTIEASGVLWDEVRQNFLLISDETKNRLPAIYSLNERGLISETHALDIDRFDDMESISADGDFIYVLSSLSYNASHKLKRKRCKFVRLKRTTSGVKLGAEINLYEVLVRLSKSEKTGVAAREYLQQSILNRSIDIESHAVLDNALYLGFKTPNSNETDTVILKVDDVAGLFSGDISHAGMWLKLNLSDEKTGAMSRLSDFVFNGDYLYLLSISHGVRDLTSYLWRYDLKHGSLLSLKKFPGVRTEGLSVARDDGVVMIVSDGNANAPSGYFFADIHRSNKLDER